MSAGRFRYAPKPKPGYRYVDGFAELLEALGSAVNTMTVIETMREDHSMAGDLGLADNPEYQIPDQETLDKQFWDVMEEAYQAMVKVGDGLGFLHAMGVMSGLFKEVQMTAGKTDFLVDDQEAVQTILLSSRIILNVFSLLIQRYLMEKQVSPEVR